MIKNNEFKNGYLSAVTGVAQQLLTLIFGLVVPRLFIASFGSEMNGLLSTLGTIYSYLTLVEAGVGTAAIQALYGPVARKDRAGINSIMAATARYYNRAGAIYLAGVLLISIVYPLTIETIVPFETVMLLSLLQGAGGVINFWIQGKYQVLFQAEGKKYLISSATTIVHLLQNVIKLSLLLLGFNVVTIHVSYFVIALIQMVYYLVIIKKNYRWLSLKVSPDRSSLSQSSAVLVQQIAAMLCHNTDTLVLTYVTKDLKLVSVYSVYNMIYSMVDRIFSTIIGSFHYVLGQLFNVDREKYMRVHKMYETLSMTCTFALFSVAYVLTIPFLQVYSAGITDISYIDPYLPLLFAMMYLIACAREASARAINFAGHFKQMQWRAIMESVINVVVSIILAIKFGIYGVILGTIVAYLYRTNDIILYANKNILKRSNWNTYKIWLVNMAVFVLICVCAHRVDLRANSFLQFFLLAIPCGLCICGIYFLVLLVLSKDAAKYIFERFAKRR